MANSSSFMETLRLPHLKDPATVPFPKTASLIWTKPPGPAAYLIIILPPLLRPLKCTNYEDPHYALFFNLPS